QGYTEPTPVQRDSIPHVLAGRDLLAGAQTGTGKTAAFVLPILQKLNATRANGQNTNTGRSPIRVLVLTPTRELALQVEESFRTYGAQRPVASTTIYGGVGFEQQVRRLRQGPPVVVATPGRLLDHVGQRTIDLSRVEILVLDEADRMLDMGFIHDIRKILALLPQSRQNLLFSATFSAEIRRLAGDFLKDPAFVQVTPKNTAPDLVKQVVIPVDKSRKREMLSHLVKSGRIYQALVFTRTKHGADRLAQQLELDGITAVAIHGNKSQPQRIRALNDFKRNKVAILVATEVAARGLDIESLPHVVNYELPMVASDYVHRIGRTGRAGEEGDAISLVCIDERPLLGEIERLLGHRIETEVVEGFRPDPTIRAQAIQLRSAEHQARRFGGRPQPDARQRGFGRPSQTSGRPSQAQGRPSYGQSRPSHGQSRPAQGSIGRPMSMPGERLSRG
ncbi:MAG: DEAD/DEAH box helicase, partial [Candidatus Limnocylindrales bacterium]